MSCLYSYSEHSHQSAAFESPENRIPAPDTTPEATLLARLVMVFVHRVTLVGASCSSLLPGMSKASAKA